MLEVTDIWKTYDGQPLLNGVSFSVGQGETVCLLGASGSGKSTLLRIITGLEQAEAGQVLWNNENLSGVAVHQRHFGLMFQDYALFPHRSVAENVAFGLRMQKLSKSAIDPRVSEALALVNMSAFARRRVTDLSGGEQQRVALARALAPRPRLLMLDEPLGALDRSLREQLIEELRRLLHLTGIPAIYVTHDQEEACTIADRLILLHDGVVEQAGTPAEVYARPASEWVARFLGMVNLVKARVLAKAHPDQPLRVETPLGILQSTCTNADNLPVGAAFTVLIRPSGARMVHPSSSGDDAINCIRGMVEDIVFHGEYYHVHLRCGDILLQLDLLSPVMPGMEVAAVPGTMAVIQLDAGAVYCMGRF
jgi:spermidine/putrescine transport system ATP-binding protein